MDFLLFNTPRDAVLCASCSQHYRSLFAINQIKLLILFLAWLFDQFILNILISHVNRVHLVCVPLFFCNGKSTCAVEADCK